jgi:hypothetical protein
MSALGLALVTVAYGRDAVDQEKSSKYVVPALLRRRTMASA